ncbi:MAG: hypothetical protein WBA05_10255 [Gordonia sp. (in: high G+C Gram-positive bacteria)]|uniref:hypothetical protein n=1 Tax=Gordonia TaxID=2053 RepID=UPI003263D750
MGADHDIPQRRSHRRVHAAVDAVLDVATHSSPGSLEDLVRAVGESRRRPIVVAVDDLAPGVWGQRREYADHDEIVLARSLPSDSRTLAHELGHVVFRHPGATVAAATVAATDDLIAYMLGMSTDAGPTAETSGAETSGAPVSAAEADLHEWEAEAFAARLLQRLSHLDRGRSWRPLIRYDEALG